MFPTEGTSYVTYVLVKTSTPIPENPGGHLQWRWTIILNACFMGRNSLSGISYACGQVGTDFIDMHKKGYFMLSKLQKCVKPYFTLQNLAKPAQFPRVASVPMCGFCTFTCSFARFRQLKTLNLKPKPYIALLGAYACKAYIMCAFATRCTCFSSSPL